MMVSWILAFLATSTICSMLAPGRPIAMFSRMVPSKRTESCSTMLTLLRNTSRAFRRVCYPSALGGDSKGANREGAAVCHIAADANDSCCAQDHQQRDQRSKLRLEPAGAQARPLVLVDVAAEAHRFALFAGEDFDDRQRVDILGGDVCNLAGGLGSFFGRGFNILCIAEHDQKECRGNRQGNDRVLGAEEEHDREDTYDG